MNKHSLLSIFLVPSFVLMIPAAAMLTHAEGWAWSPSDFAVAWLFLAGAMGIYKLAASKARNRTYRLAAGLAVTTGLVLLWVNGAVGFIGSENNPANRMYLGVLAVGLSGAAMARWRATGMVYALLATAAAQFVVPIVALMFWRNDFSPGVVPVFGLNFGFVLLFAAAAFLFRRAATYPDRADGAAVM